MTKLLCKLAIVLLIVNICWSLHKDYKLLASIACNNLHLACCIASDHFRIEGRYFKIIHN